MGKPISGASARADAQSGQPSSGGQHQGQVGCQLHVRYLLGVPLRNVPAGPAMAYFPFTYAFMQRSCSSSHPFANARGNIAPGVSMVLHATNAPVVYLSRLHNQSPGGVDDTQAAQQVFVAINGLPEQRHTGCDAIKRSPRSGFQ